MSGASLQLSQPMILLLSSTHIFTPVKTYVWDRAGGDTNRVNVVSKLETRVEHVYGGRTHSGLSLDTEVWAGHLHSSLMNTDLL